MRKGTDTARLFVVLLLLFMIFPIAGNGQEVIPIHDRNYKEADLPTGGNFIQHPTNKPLIYYFTNQNRMWPDKSNAQKHAGLYRSTDGGQTWHLTCHFFEFKHLFIHPETEMIYAIVEYKWLAPEKGFLVPNIADKAVASIDGKNWRDIMGKQKYVAELYGIFADPDNPGRVCLKASVIRSTVLQSMDDEYSNWKWEAMGKWKEKHPEWEEK